MNATEQYFLSPRGVKTLFLFKDFGDVDIKCFQAELKRKIPSSSWLQLNGAFELNDCLN